MSYFRNFCPGACRALPGTHIKELELQQAARQLSDVLPFGPAHGSHRHRLHALRQRCTKGTNRASHCRWERLYFEVHHLHTYHRAWGR